MWGERDGEKKMEKKKSKVNSLKTDMIAAFRRKKITSFSRTVQLKPVSDA